MTTQRERRQMLYRCKNQMSEELERAINMKNSCSYDDSVIGVKVSSLTREKIFRQGLLLFKLMKEHNKEQIKKELVVFLKRQNLHIYQLRKLNQGISVEDNIRYFNTINKLIMLFLRM